MLCSMPIHNLLQVKYRILDLVQFKQQYPTGLSFKVGIKINVRRFITSRSRIEVVPSDLPLNT